MEPGNIVNKILSFQENRKTPEPRIKDIRRLWKNTESGKKIHETEKCLERKWRRQGICPKRNKENQEIGRTKIRRKSSSELGNDKILSMEKRRSNSEPGNEKILSKEKRRSNCEPGNERILSKEKRRSNSDPGNVKILSNEKKRSNGEPGNERLLSKEKRTLESGRCVITAQILLNRIRRNKIVTVLYATGYLTYDMILTINK